MYLLKAKPKLSQSPDISELYEKLELRDRKGSPFFVIVDNKRNSFENWLYKERPTSVVAYVIQLILRGSGNLIDVGAHIGTVSIPVAQLGTRVFSFEMHPENCIKLSIGRYINKLPNLYVTQAAVTDKDRVLYFVSSGPWASISKVPSSAMVAGYRLDMLMEMSNLTPPSRLRGDVVIKIDVEGHDHKVLLGADSTIKKYRPVIIYESMMGASKEGSLAAAIFLRDREYIFFEIHENAFVPVDEMGRQESFLMDYLAVPRSKADRILSRIKKGMPVRPLTPYERLKCVRIAAESNESIEHPLHAINVLAEWEFSDRSMARFASEVASNLRNHQDELVRGIASKRLR
ncbi:FkbM family methyltransferase [Sphingomonas sp. UYEF23]|uniref:FkbM family methyltransferase n=1 Tax=Sphingomonas sp. UYEF23 TaxID=1756408 RepID=UPI00339B7EA5